ncbi:MAG: SpoIIE family protein phosphatase [Bacteroidales bacterium]|nr:SpoIIE family protein phosphatase [Bacteroidales bacterium]
MTESNAKSSLDRLKFSNYKLKTLLNITKAINNNSSVEELLDTFCTLLTDELHIGKVLIYSYQNKKWNIILKSGVAPKEYCNIDPERDLVEFTDMEITLSIPKTKYSAFDFIIPVIQDNNPLAYVLIGDFEEEQTGISPSIKHIHFIQTLTNVIIVAIENKRLIEVNMQQERIKKEMEMASEMQKMLVPKADIFANDNRVSVNPFYLPHFEVGGDYYDFDYLSKDEMFFCIADVSGKGMSAAILMSNFQASLKALFIPEMELTTLVRRLNKIIVRNANGDRFITLFIGRYNFNTHELRYVNAGHNSPVIYYKKTGKLEYLTAGCPGVGMLDEIPNVTEGKIVLDHECKLLCFTDGVVELEKENIPDYGQKVVEKNVANSKSIKDTISDIIKELDIQRSNTSLFDDITLLGVEFFV